MIVMWRFLRNRRLILRLHIISRTLIYWAHRAVIFVIAWLLVLLTTRTNFHNFWQVGLYTIGNLHLEDSRYS